MSNSNSPGWVRVAQIGLGVLVIILSISILIQPTIATVSLVVIADCNSTDSRDRENYLWNIYIS